MHRIRLIHWNSDEAEERARRLRAAGYRVACELASGARLLSELRANPPAAVVVDLSRLPMHGRDVGLALRHSKSTRSVPLVFVDGGPEKIARTKHSLPDAIYTRWSRIRSALKKAMAHPPAKPVVPASALAGYSGTPLVRKLGIKPNSVVVLVDPPAGFERTLGTLPEGVRLGRGSRARGDLTLWFTRTRRELKRLKAVGATTRGGLWICWPKQASGLKTDLTQTPVRTVGLAAGWVDHKICAVDATWSGLRFVRRKSKKG